MPTAGGMFAKLIESSIEDLRLCGLDITEVTAVACKGPEIPEEELAHHLEHLVLSTPRMPSPEGASHGNGFEGGKFTGRLSQGGASPGMFSALRSSAQNGCSISVAGSLFLEQSTLVGVPTQDTPCLIMFTKHFHLHLLHTGKELTQGRVQSGNSMGWQAAFNGLFLSEDAAQRCLELSAAVPLRAQLAGLRSQLQTSFQKLFYGEELKSTPSAPMNIFATLLLYLIHAQRGVQGRDPGTVMNVSNPTQGKPPPSEVVVPSNGHSCRNGSAEVFRLCQGPLLGCVVALEHLCSCSLQRLLDIYIRDFSWQEAVSILGPHLRVLSQQVKAANEQILQNTEFYSGLEQLLDNACDELSVFCGTSMRLETIRDRLTRLGALLFVLLRDITLSAILGSSALESLLKGVLEMQVDLGRISLQGREAAAETSAHGVRATARFPSTCSVPAAVRHDQLWNPKRATVGTAKSSTHLICKGTKSC
eukprot:jgi/Botrbrau1/2389/Bobra.0395s0021.1